MEIGNLVKGLVGEALNLDKDPSEGRLKICYRCPLYSSTAGGICNDLLWLNKETGELSAFETEGYKNGCGCYLPFKVKNTNSRCPLEKW